MIDTRKQPLWICPLSHARAADLPDLATTAVPAVLSLPLRFDGAPSRARFAAFRLVVVRSVCWGLNHENCAQIRPLLAVGPCPH